MGERIGPCVSHSSASMGQDCDKPVFRRIENRYTMDAVLWEFHETDGASVLVCGE
jgi:hypothetical protein